MGYTVVATLSSGERIPITKEYTKRDAKAKLRQIVKARDDQGKKFPYDPRVVNVRNLRD